MNTYQTSNQFPSTVELYRTLGLGIKQNNNIAIAQDSQSRLKQQANVNIPTSMFYDDKHIPSTVELYRTLGLKRSNNVATQDCQLDLKQPKNLEIASRGTTTYNEIEQFPSTVDIYRKLGLNVKRNDKSQQDARTGLQVQQTAAVAFSSIASDVKQYPSMAELYQTLGSKIPQQSNMMDGRLVTDLAKQASNAGSSFIATSTTEYKYPSAIDIYQKYGSKRGIPNMSGATATRNSAQDCAEYHSPDQIVTVRESVKRQLKVSVKRSHCNEGQWCNCCDSSDSMDDDCDQIDDLNSVRARLFDQHPNF